MYPKKDWQAEWEAAGYIEKPWFDWAHLLSAFGITIADVDDADEQEALNKQGLDQFYAGISEDPLRIAGLRKLLTDLAWWNNSTCSDLWGFIAKMDDESMLRVCYPLFFMLWD